MRIAIVLMKYNPFGGYERQAAILAEEMRGRGHEVTVFANDWKGGERNGIIFRKVPMLKLASWLKVLSFAVMSRRLLEAEPFDAVIAFDRSLSMDVYRAGNACHREWMAFRKRHGGARESLSMAINPLHVVINGIERRIFSRIQEKKGTIVVLSQLGREQIRRHYDVDAERFAVIPPVVDLDRLNAAAALQGRDGERKRLSIPEGTTALLHVGSGFRIKGLSATIEALGLLSGRGKECVLLVAGSDKKETAGLKGLASSLGVEERVHFLGGVKDVSALYAAGDVFVVPSLFETFGVAAVEALAFGLPVIVGSGAGAADFIRAHNAGRVVETPASPERLASLVEEAIDEDAGLKEKGLLEGEKRRRADVAAKCGRGPVMEKYVPVLERAAGGEDAID